MPTRIDPSLYSGLGGSYTRTGGTSSDALASLRSRRSGFENQDWDPIIRPIERTFNALTAGASGVMNVVDKKLKFATENGPLGYLNLANPIDSIGHFANGFFASWNNDPESENYMTGSKLIESATDSFGKAYNPDYVDQEDNVNPWVKGIGGFVADVALDPITYVPGGILASGVRGGIRGAKAGMAAAKAGEVAANVPKGAVSGALRGVFKGVPDQYKVGRFTKAPKAIGIEQWKQVRGHEKILKIQRKHGLTEDMMFAITSGEHGVKALTEEILPRLRETAGPEYKANLTPEVVQEIADKAGKYIEDYTSVASGVEGARSVASGMAPAEGAAAYLYADPKTGAVKAPVTSRPSALARREAVVARLTDEKALSDLEIQRYDVEASLQPLLVKRAELANRRQKLDKSVKLADTRAAKPNAAAARESANAAIDAERAAIDAESVALETEIAGLGRTLSGLQQSSAELAAKHGRTPEQVQAISDTIDTMAANGVRYSPIMSLDPSNVRLPELLAIDAERELTPGASEMMLQSLSIALKNGQIDDNAIGQIAGTDVTLSDVIDLLYAPHGTEDLAKIKGLIPEAIDFYTDMVHQVLSKMWDITGATIRVAANGIPVENLGRAANGMDLLEYAATQAARENVTVARETLTDIKTQLQEFTPEVREQRPEEYYALVEQMSQAEEALRYIEQGGDEATNKLAPFMFTGGVESAVEAAQIAGIRPGGPLEYQDAILANIETVRDAIRKIELEKPAALQAKTDAVIAATSALIRAHSGTDDILQNVKAIIGEGNDPVRGLLDVVFGTFRPLKGAEADPTLYAKLIIELAKLPFEIPGVSSTARLRARAFAEAGQLGVYGIESNIDDAALERYGREMLNNFQVTGGYVSAERLKNGIEVTPEQALEDMSDLVNRQAKASDEAAVELSGDNAQIGFGMGDEAEGIRGEGRLGALNLFGEVVARGNTEDELARNLELYRGAVAREAATAVTNTLESAITGRPLEYRGETVSSWRQWWDDNLAGFLSPNKTSNHFNQNPGTIIRGKYANGYRRILDNDNAELDGYGTRLSPEQLLITDQGTSPLSFTHAGVFKLEDTLWQTGAHALYGLMTSPAARKRIAAAETVAEAKRIFDNLKSKDINPKYLTSNNIERGNYMDEIADRIVAARINVPGVREAMPGSVGFNIVDGFDRVIGGELEEVGFGFFTRQRTRGANTAGRAVMRMRDKALGVDAKNLSFYENSLPTGGNRGNAQIDTEFNKLVDGNKDLFPDLNVSRQVAKEKASALEEFRKANPDAKEPPADLVAPGAIDALKISDHILGYARKPLSFKEWIATIHLAATNSKRSGEFFGRYRAVATALGIPFEDGAKLAGALENAKAKEAYDRYLTEFRSVLDPEVKAGVEIRVAETLQARGGEQRFDKGEFKDLREMSSTSYGVDPLGRSVRDAEDFGAKGGSEPTLYAQLTSLTTENDVKAVLNVLKKAKTEEEVIASLNKTIGERLTTAVMPIIRQNWADTRKMGYTPESVGTISDIRSALAGSAVGVRTILEDLLPDLRITRETQEDFIAMLRHAENIVTEERLQVAVRELDVVLNGPAVAALADPAGEATQILLNFAMYNGKVARKIAPVADEVITSAEKEVRDWATGGVKMKRDKDPQFGGEDFTLYDSFSDIAVQDLMRELVPQAAAHPELLLKVKDAFRAIAKKAQELHEQGPDGAMRPKNAEQYPAEMQAVIAAELETLKGKFEITKMVPLSQSPGAERLLYTSAFRKTLEQFLQTSKHSLHVDILKNLDKMAPAMDQTPVPTWNKFVQKVDALLGREVKGTGGMRDRFSGTATARVQELLQIDEAGHSRLISGTVGAKNVDEFFSLAQKDIIDRTNIIDQHSVLGGEQIMAAAETVDEAAHMATIADDIAKVLDATKKTPELAVLGEGVINKFRTRIADSIVNTMKSLKKEKDYNTYGNDVDRRVMHDILQEIDRAGRAGDIDEDGIAYLKYLALKMADEELARMGVSRVTTLGFKNAPGRIAYSINGDIDWAYLGYSDVMTVLRQTGNNALAKRLLTEIMPDTTKAIRGVETGLIFPPNVIAEIGVLAMKLRIGGVAENDAAAILYSTITERLRVTPGGLFNSAIEKVNMVLPEGPNAERIAEIALAFSRADVQDAIIERHVTNGAIALQRAGELSRNIIEPVVKDIMKARTSPLSTLDDVVDQIIKSSGRVRARIEKFGIKPDTLAGHLSRGAIQKLLNGAYNATEMNIARVTSRTRRIYDEVKDLKPGVDRTNTYRRLHAEEATRLASQRIKTTNRLSAENTAILIEDLVNQGDPISMAAAFDVAISSVESSMEASLRIAQIHFGGPNYLEAVESQKSRAREIAMGIAGTKDEVKIKTERLKELAGMRANLEAKKIKLEKKKIEGKPASTTKAQAKRKTDLKLLDEELNAVNTRIAELGLGDKFNDLAFIPDDMDRIVLQSQGDTSLGFRAGSALSGSLGMEDTISTVARTENSIDNNINSYEKMVEKLESLVGKKFTGPDADKAVLDWGNQIIRSLWVDKMPIDTLLKKINGPDMKALTLELHRLSAELFSEKSMIWIRSGMDAAHINKFIKQSPFGATAAALFQGGRLGHEMHGNLIDNIVDLLGAPDGAGGASWITMLKGYSWSLQRAAMIPTIAAEFSARFGHKAAGRSIEEARAMGYQAIKREGTLAKWLDPNSLYPPEYLRQLANTQRFLDIDPRVSKDGTLGKLILGVDKVTGALKSSITLWRPGHHVVNIMGEALMNVLAGVMNPVQYARAWKTMRSVGEFQQGTIAGHNFDIPLNQFTEGYKTTAFTGKNGDEGIVMQLAGREVVISYPEFYRMLNEKGLLINNNTAEDIIVQGEQIIGSRNRYSGLLGKLQRMNEGLGGFSARRDNLFRIAHAIDIASKKGHRSMSSMIDDISSEVMSYHPTMQLLSPFEKKYMRRAMYFYTWQRNAISVVFRTMLENPALFTLAPKAIYEASSIGGEPESIGHPMPNDMRLPGFMAANTLGPHWINANGDVEGFTLNAPQLDIFNTVFGELYVDPTQNALDNVTRNLGTFYRENTIGQMSPLPKTVIEGWMGSKYTTSGPQPIDDWGDYLTDMTGLGYISRIAGIGILNNQGLFAPRSDAKDPETRARYGLNALTGLRFQDMSQYGDVAKRQRDERTNRGLEELRKRLGIAP